MSANNAASEPRHNQVAGSFRDPGGHVFTADGAIYRTLDHRALGNWNTLASTRMFSEGVAAGRIVATSEVDDVPPPGSGEWAGVLRHERIPTITYPYEWTFSMLKDAALLQLDLLAGALAEGMILKDSTPYNIQFRGTDPVFIDIGSFEVLEPGDVWVGYRQFLAQFLYPLMLTARVGIPFQPLLRGQPDGITAGQMHDLLSAKDRWRKSSILHVNLAARAERRGSGAGRDVRTEMKESGFSKEMIEANVKGLRKLVDSLTWDPGTTAWNEYASACGHVAVQRDAKAAFVEDFTREIRPRTVWDVGANDGHFAKIAATHAEGVLALDADAAVIDDLYQSLKADGPDNVLPIVQDLADPSPGLGWRGSERPPLEDRSSPDLVLALAVVHHLVVGRNVPLGSFVDWMSDLGAAFVFEFVPRDDPMVEALTINKRPHEVHRDYSEAALRSYLDGRFSIVREADVPGGGRRLFALVPSV